MPNLRELSRTIAKVGVAGAVAFGSSPAQASEIPQSSNEISNQPCIPSSFSPENPNLGDFIGAPVRIPNNLSEVKVRPLENFPGSEYFYPIYDPDKADEAHMYVGIGPHYAVAYQNLDGNYAADLLTWRNRGELVVQAKNGGRFAISYLHEFAHQGEGTYYIDSSGQKVFNPNLNMAYWFEGLLPGQSVKAVDPDTGRQLRYNDGTLVEVFPNQDGRLGVALPKTCNSDARVQFVLNIINNPQFPPQQIKIRRGPDDKFQANSLPGGVIKPQIPGD